MHMHNRALPQPTIRGHRRCRLIMVYTQGRRPMGDWGDVPPKNLRWGTAHALVPPIFREVVLSDARESTKRVKKGVFLVRKGSNMTFNIYIPKIGKMWEKKEKSEKSGR